MANIPREIQQVVDNCVEKLNKLIPIKKQLYLVHMPKGHIYNKIRNICYAIILR